MSNHIETLKKLRESRTNELHILKDRVRALEEELHDFNIIIAELESSSPTAYGNDIRGELFKHSPLGIKLVLRTAGLASVESAKFGMVRNNGTRAHQGIDLECEPNYRCYAVADGTVKTRYTDSYGSQVTLKIDGTDKYIFYAHLNRVDVKDGQRVKAGDVIGLTGSTGNAKGMDKISNGAHLHFEVRNDWILGTGLEGREDPLPYLVKYM